MSAPALTVDTAFAADAARLEAFLDFEWLASEPYARFVFRTRDRARAVARALIEAGSGEIAPPFGKLYVDAASGAPVGMVAGPLAKSELAKARMRAARTLSLRPDLIEAVPERSSVAAGALLTVAPGDAYLSRIAVDPTRRGGGFGPALLERFLADARATGAARAVLEVAPEHEAARRMYERAGFRVREERRVTADDGAVLAYAHLELGL